MESKPKLLDTEHLSMRFRKASLDASSQSVLLARFTESDQEPDITLPVNCGGFGRVHTFRRRTSSLGWPDNPLPLEPACRALGFDNRSVLRAQVFQIASCNWRCWYCYVPFNMLAANRKHADFVSVGDLVEYYKLEPERCPVIDLSGGQPDLVPEWVPWVMRELRSQGLEQSTYLWSDDNLSNDYLWRYLKSEDLELLASYPNYGRVCCYKGFDESSFQLNTRAEPRLFWQQLALSKRLLDIGIDLYGYITLTNLAPETGLRDMIRHFFDSLMEIDTNWPLRVVPLEIVTYSVVKDRMTNTFRQALAGQHRAIEHWVRELADRYSALDRSQSICDVRLGTA